jgi:hypothetical protein
MPFLHAATMVFDLLNKKNNQTPFVTAKQKVLAFVDWKTDYEQSTTRGTYRSTGSFYPTVDRVCGLPKAKALVEDASGH